MTREEIERCRVLGHFVGEEMFNRLCDAALKSLPVQPERIVLEDPSYQVSINGSTEWK